MGEGQLPPLYALPGKHGRVCAPQICMQDEGRLLLWTLPQVPNLVAMALSVRPLYHCMFIICPSPEKLLKSFSIHN